MDEAQLPFLELLRRKREELVARQAAVMQEAQVAQQQAIALGGAIAGVDEMLAALAASETPPTADMNDAESPQADS